MMTFTGKDGRIHGIEELTRPRKLDEINEKERQNLISGIDRVKKLQKEMKDPYAFLFFTDAHLRQNKMKSPALMEKVGKECGIKDTLYAGDTISAYVDEELCREDMRFFAENFLFGHTYVARGNHDIEGKPFEESKDGCVISQSEAQELLFLSEPQDVIREAGKTYYYFDRPEKSLRFVILDTNEMQSNSLGKDGTWWCKIENGAEQIAFLTETLKNTPENYRVVIVGHIPAHPLLPWYNERLTYLCGLVGSYNKRLKFHAAVKKCIEMNVVNADDGEFTVDADFTEAKGEVVLFLSGHGHTDGLACSDGCAYAEVNCDSFIDNGGSPYRRIANTDSEQVFDVILIGSDGRIEEVRFGAGEDRTLRAGKR